MHNIRSLHNVGSIFRTADAAGITKLYLTGYTPAPLDEMGRPRKEIVKTALGAEDSVPWEKAPNITKTLGSLKKQGFTIVALEQSKEAVNFKNFQPRFPLALLVGNEVRGLSRAVLKKSDLVIKIPIYGKKESLNVAVAFGIAVYEIVSKQELRF